MKNEVGVLDVKGKPLKRIKAIIVGTGCIGAKLAHLLKEGGHEVVAKANSKAVFRGNPADNGTLSGSITYTGDFPQVAATLQPLCRDANVAFIAIPTKDRGETAWAYIQLFLERGLSVITAEKGALAYHYAKLAPYLGKIGFSATCGGGTGIIAALKEERVAEKDIVVHAVINGTLNFVWYAVANGIDVATAVSRAIGFGYAEPGCKGVDGLVNGELGDIGRKICILNNAVFAKAGGPFITPDDIRAVEVSATNVDELVNEQHRYVVTATRGDVPEVRRAGSLYVEADGWKFVGGFRNIAADERLSSWLRDVPGVFNGYFLQGVHADGQFESGPGAGAEPTAKAMLCDALRLLEDNGSRRCSASTAALADGPVSDMCNLVYADRLPGAEPGFVNCG